MSTSKSAATNVTPSIEVLSTPFSRFPRPSPSSNSSSTNTPPAPQKPSPQPVSPCSLMAAISDMPRELWVIYGNSPGNLSRWSLKSPATLTRDWRTTPTVLAGLRGVYAQGVRKLGYRSRYSYRIWPNWTPWWRSTRISSRLRRWPRSRRPVGHATGCSHCLPGVNWCCCTFRGSRQRWDC